jgi:hypothetical protein
MPTSDAAVKILDKALKPKKKVDKGKGKQKADVIDLSGESREDSE